jgi:hypothetical protein
MRDRACGAIMTKIPAERFAAARRAPTRDRTLKAGFKQRARDS